MYRRSDSLSTIPYDQNTLTHQSTNTNDAPRYPLFGPVTSAKVFFVRRFPEEAPKFPEIFLQSFLRELDFFPSDLLRGLHSCRRVFNHLTACLASLFWALDSPKVLDFLGFFIKLSEGLLCNCEQHPGKFAPCRLFPLSCDEKGFGRLFSLSTTGFLV